MEERGKIRNESGEKLPIECYVEHQRTMSRLYELLWAGFSLAI